MTTKTTNQDLNSAIKRINQLIPQKTFDWYKTQNHYYMATDRGSRRHISARTKRELYFKTLLVMILSPLSCILVWLWLLFLTSND